MTPKFRAWDVKDRRWLSPLNLLMDMTGELYWGFAGTVKYQGNQKTTNIIIEQWTGLPDRNGVEIYEGDIYRQIVWMNGRNEGIFLGQIVWERDSWRFLPINEQITFRIDSGKVIGNIHENPELLEAS